METDFDELYERYVLRFGEAPRETFGMDDDTLAVLMREAIQKGNPITEDEYSRHLPKGALV